MATTTKKKTTAKKTTAKKAPSTRAAKAKTTKPVAKKAVAKKKPTTARKTTAKKKPVASRKTAAPRKSSAKKAQYQTLQATREIEDFMSMKITTQTIYWAILILVVVFLQLWIVQEQIAVSQVIEQQQQQLRDASRITDY